MAPGILAKLVRLGIKLEIHNGSLRYSPQRAVSTDLVEEMQANKDELFLHLFFNGDCRLGEETIDVNRLSPCQQCGSLELWQTVAGTWRCQHCDADDLEYCRELADRLIVFDVVNGCPPRTEDRKGPSEHR